MCRVAQTLNGTIWNTVQWVVWSNDTDNHWTSTGNLYVFLDTDRILLKTSMGDIKIQLYDDMPITTANFKRLVRNKTYDGTIFHRVIKGFVIQGGDPTGTGQGDPSIPAIPDEFTDHNRNSQWTVAMANAGPNTGSSQFFINLVTNSNRTPDFDANYPVFGQVVSGTDVVAAIGNVQTDQNDKPIQPVVILQAIPVN
jgi:peptidylprolyl isomerase